MMVKIDVKIEQEVMEKSKDLAPGYKWKTQRNEYLSPCEMSTHHMFNVIKMVWNHTVPERMKLKPYNWYSFSSFYTVSYMKQSVWFLMRELRTRKDLTQRQMQDLAYMAECMRMQGYTERLEEEYASHRIEM